MYTSVMRFLQAQEAHFATALQEIQSGRKVGHWMWYIFPQIKGLGKSCLSRKYAIRSLEEAKAYLQNAILKMRLISISEALLQHNGSIREILDFPDDRKLQSCMTLFREADPSIEVFQAVLNRFYNGKVDEKTLEILYGEK